MKITTIIRTQIVLGTIAAALLLAGSAYAQQETEPTPFADGPTVTAFAQPTITAASDTMTISATNSAAVAANQSDSDSSVVEEAGVAQWTPADEFSVTILLAAMGMFIAYGTWVVKRERSTRSFRPGTLTPSAATTR